MSQLKEFFSSKPKQIAKAIVKISHQIFGKISNVEVAIIGDERGVSMSKEESREQIYGIPYQEWKEKFQK